MALGETVSTSSNNVYVQKWSLFYKFQSSFVIVVFTIRIFIVRNILGNWVIKNTEFCNEKWENIFVCKKKYRKKGMNKKFILIKSIKV